MSVSYLSRPFKSSPYVQPLDLNLFGKVMSYKEGKFDEGVNQTQSEIDKLGQLDLIKPEDHDYLKGKVNSLVEQINGFGGLDFSDRNTLNQIEGLGRNIYGDERILNAVSSTASVRSLVKSYNDYKTNPKLSKLYSPVNEAYDMNKVSQWMNDGQVGSAYHGAAVATPYTPYRENHLKALDKIKADLVETIDQNGLYILKEGHERVTPERLMSMAADMLTPDERAQMKKDAWYLYNVQSPTAPETLINKGMQQYYTKLNDAKMVWDNYEAQAKASANDPAAREEFLKLAGQAKTAYNAVAGQEAASAQQLISAYKNDPEEFQYQLYSNDYFRGLANRFSVNRTTRSVQFDQAQMFQRRMDQSDDQFKERMKRVDRGLDIKELEAMGKVFKTIDPKTGKAIYVPADDLKSTNLNLQDPEDLKVSEKSIVASNSQLFQQIDGIHQDFIDQIIAQRPDLGITVQSKNGTGVSRLLKGQQAVENFNGRPGFQMDDLGSYKQNAEGLKKTYGMTDEQIKYLSTLFDNYAMMTAGKGAAVPDLPNGFADVVEKTTLIRQQIDANNAKIQSVRNDIFDRAGLDRHERYIYNKYLDHPGAVPMSFPSRFLSGLNGYNSQDLATAEQIDKVEAKVRHNIGKEYDKEATALYAAIATRDVNRTKVFSINDPTVKSTNMQRFILDNLGSATPLKGSSKVASSDVTNLENVIPLTAGMSADGKGFYITAQIVTGSGDSKSSSTVQIPVDDNNAKVFGLQRDPYESINYAVRLSGRTSDIPVYYDKNLAVNVQVVAKNTHSMNDDTSFAQASFQMLDKDGNPTGQTQLVQIPATDGRTPSEAYALAKEAILQAGRAGISFKDFKDYLYNFKPSR